MKKKIVFLLICLIFIFAGVISYKRIAGGISMQSPEKRWSDDGSAYAHIAVYFPETQSITLEDVDSYRNSLNLYIKEDGIEVKEGSRAYIDAYSAYGNVEISVTDRNTSCKTDVTYCGGDYFFFHPAEFLYGSGFGEDDTMRDKAVIDENAAWMLYGSTDICGKYMMMGDKMFYICGVVRSTEKNLNIYVPYNDKNNAEEKHITCYETVYPDLISDYAYKKVMSLVNEDTLFADEESEKDDTSSADVINITDRFDISNIFGVVCSYGKRSMQTNAIIYPDWENECREAEDFCALAMVWVVIWIIISVCLALKWFAGDVVSAAVRFAGSMKNTLQNKFKRK